MMVARVILLDVAVHLRTRLAEWVFAAILAAFAYRLMASENTFDTSPSYTYMALWMHQKVWGELIGVVAFLRLSALTANGTFRRLRAWTPAIRAGTAWMSCSVWGSLAAGFFISNPNATGWGTYSVICAADLCLAITIAHDAGHAIRTRQHADARSQ